MMVMLQDMRAPNLYGRYNASACMQADRLLHETGLVMKACPFCHTNNTVVWLPNYPHVECMYCGAEGPKVKNKAWEGGIQMAVERWNNRLAPEVPSLKGTQ